MIGPLVICLYIIDKEKESYLVKLGVRDSKLLSPNKRLGLYDKIKQSATKVSTYHLTPKELNQKMKTKTLNLIEQEIMLKLVKEISLPIRTLYIDAADVNERRFGEPFARLLNNTEIISKHQADKYYPVVSAASIIAKVERDREIQKIQNRLGEEIGSGYPSDPKTREFLLRYYKKYHKMPDFVRLAWSTVEKIIKEAEQEQRKLTDFF